MKKALIPVLAAAALAGLSQPAVATNGPNSVAAIYEAGRCIVREDRDAAVALIRSLPLDGDAADLTMLRGDAADCVRGTDSAGVMAVRGAIAQALFFRDFHRFGMQPQFGRRLANLNLPVESSTTTEPAVDLYRWSDCVVRNDTVGTERLLRSTVGSGEEGAALEGLRNFMSACIADGAEIRVRNADVRSLFAQSAYNTMYRYWTGQLSAANRRRN